MFNKPTNIAFLTIAAAIAGFIIQVILPYQINTSHGSFAALSLEDALVLKGQEVYQQEGCVYCHTKNLRPFLWEMKRFSDMEKYGYFPESTAQGNYYDSPALMGSQRIGPDLSRISSKMSDLQIKAILSSAKGGNTRGGFHMYSGLFQKENKDALSLSWKVRALMNAGMPYSDPFQKSVFSALEGTTRGEALVAYLSTLGKKEAQYAGNFYK